MIHYTSLNNKNLNDTLLQYETKEISNSTNNRYYINSATNRYYINSATNLMDNIYTKKKENPHILLSWSLHMNWYWGFCYLYHLWKKSIYKISTFKSFHLDNPVVLWTVVSNGSSSTTDFFIVVIDLITSFCFNFFQYYSLCSLLLTNT